jgi:hypothetical protein
VKYFVLRGLLAKPYENAPSIGGSVPTTRKERVRRWTRFGSSLPKEGEFEFLRQPGVGRLSVVVYDVYDALLMVTAPSQRKAYALALPFRSYVTVYLGFPPWDDGIFEFLVELNGKPALTMTARDIASLHRPPGDMPSDPDILSNAIRSGPALDHAQIRDACAFVKKVLGEPRLVATLKHLERSHELFAGHMTESFYRFHYSRDRKRESVYAREKKYLEEGTRYDLAFLSAFRALEALLDTAQIKDHEIDLRLRALDQRFHTSFAVGRWESFHEVFTSGWKRWRFNELIARYLKVRNAVAAHANPKPPFPLREDQVLEIQRLVEGMLYEVAG